MIINCPWKVNILYHIKWRKYWLQKTCRDFVWNVLFLFLDSFDRVPPLVTDYSRSESTSSEATGSKNEIKIFIFDSELHAPVSVICIYSVRPHLCKYTDKKEALFSSYRFLLFAQLFPYVTSFSLAMCLSCIAIYRMPPEYVTSAPKYKQTMIL